MKRHAIFCRTPDQLMMKAFGRSMTRSKAKGYAPWMCQLHLSRAMLDRTIAELHFTDRPQWIRMTPPRPSAPRLGRGGRQRCLLAWDAEVALVADMERRAAAGEEISVTTIIAEIASRTGKRASPQAVSDLLKRQGMVRVGVRPVWERRWDCARRKVKRLRDAQGQGQAPTPHGRHRVDALAAGPEKEPPAPGANMTPVRPPSPSPTVPTAVVAVAEPELVS